MKKAVKSFLRYLGYEIRALPSLPRHVIFDERQMNDYGGLKSFAARAAQFAASPQQLQAIRSMDLTGLLRGQPSSAYSRIEIGDDKTLKVGIWKRNLPGADFVLDRDRSGEQFYWSKARTLGVKRPKWRVALLGESVARGYLYDPHFNPAAALQAMLEARLGRGNIDVVDLAKSNLTMQELKVIAGQCLALSPDVLVIFAGNNWRPRFTEADVPYVESLIRSDGVPGMKAHFDEVQRRAVETLMLQMSKLIAPRGIKIIWVVPEFNLADWADPASNAPYLPKLDNQQWREWDQQLAHALGAGNFSVATDLAKQMTALDRGTSSTPLRALAECCRSQGDLAGTRRYLELCRDAEGWDPSFSYSPRTSLAIQSALRGGASHPGSVIVDLPAVLQNHFDSGLPDRRMFVDYCHLSLAGITAACAEIGSQIISLLGGQAIAPQALRSDAPSVPDEVEGNASFLAAVHNAHFYQRAEIVRYWCDRAMQHWAECGEVMMRVLDYTTRRIPLAVSKAGQELLELDRLRTLDYLSRGGAQRLDLLLCDAFAACLDRAGVDMTQNLARLRQEYHSLAGGPKDLTDFYYSSAIPALSERGWTSRSLPTNRGSHALYASAFWFTSKFIFFAERACGATLHFTYRVPAPTKPGASVTVDINGRRAATLIADRVWRTSEVRIQNAAMMDGMNEVTITWPSEEAPSEPALAEMADDLIAGRLRYFHRVFGEIHALWAFDSSSAATSASRWRSLL